MAGWDAGAPAAVLGGRFGRISRGSQGALVRYSRTVLRTCSLKREASISLPSRQTDGLNKSMSPGGARDCSRFKLRHSRRLDLAETRLRRAGNGDGDGEAEQAVEGCYKRATERFTRIVRPRQLVVRVGTCRGWSSSVISE